MIGLIGRRTAARPALSAGRAARVLALLAAVGCALAWAPFEAAADRSLGKACQLDFQLFCPDVDPESPRSEVVSCLRPHLATLTETCRAVLDPSTVPRAAGGGTSMDPFAVCRDDFRRLCPKVRDRMEAARCVHLHLDSLSPACRDAITSRPGSGGAAGSGSVSGGASPSRP